MNKLLAKNYSVSEVSRSQDSLVHKGMRKKLVDELRRKNLFDEKILKAMDRVPRHLFIPKGFAHGFSVLSKTAEVFYKCDEFYNQASEGGILYNDPFLNIDWKIPENKMIVSEKDIQNPLFKDCKNNFVFET